MVTLPIFDYKKVPKNDFLTNSRAKTISSKINLNHVAVTVFDIRNKFHANRVKFVVFVVKIFNRPILTYFVSPWTKNQKV